MLGTPARPLAEALQEAIGTMLLSMGGVLEAHVPQCFAIGVMAQPVQVLVVVIDTGASSEEVVDEILLGLTELLPEDLQLDVWPLEREHSLLASIQATNCRIM